jgi:hypothetical protein
MQQLTVHLLRALLMQTPKPSFSWWLLRERELVTAENLDQNLGPWDGDGVELGTNIQRQRKSGTITGTVLPIQNLPLWDIRMERAHFRSRG